MQELSCVASRRADMQNSCRRVSGPRCKNKQMYCFVLFTIYYSRNLDFLHRGPPTLNVGQQIYCVFYYLLFRTESEIFFASLAADPEERPAWPPFYLLCTIPYGKFRETWIFCIAGHQP